jgi:hypothetical protein
MADLKNKSGDEKARESLLHFVAQLTQEEMSGKVAKNNFVARSDIRARMRSIRGRIENALPAVEAQAAREERARIVNAIRRGANQPGLDAAHRDTVLAVADDLEMGLLP